MQKPSQSHKLLQIHAMILKELESIRDAFSFEIHPHLFYQVCVQREYLYLGCSESRRAEKGLIGLYHLRDCPK